MEGGGGPEARHERDQALPRHARLTAANSQMKKDSCLTFNTGRVIIRSVERRFEK